MKQILYFLIVTLLFSNLAFSQIANGPLVYELCDDNTTDGYTQFDLTTLDVQLLGNQNPSEFTASYYATQADAEMGLNSLQTPFVNYTNPQTLFGRVNENSTGSYDLTTIDLIVIDQSNCTDSDSDGVSNFQEDINSNGILDDDNTDMDNLANYLDDDDDNDGILTIDEDYNNNGDPSDDDTDNSGIPDYLEANVALSITSFETQHIKIFPNPSNDIVKIQGITQISDISMYDLQGKIIKLDLIRNDALSELEFSVKNLEGGLYFIKIQHDLKKTIIKLMVK